MSATVYNSLVNGFALLMNDVIRDIVPERDVVHAVHRRGHLRHEVPNEWLRRTGIVWRHVRTVAASFKILELPISDVSFLNHAHDGNRRLTQVSFAQRQYPANSHDHNTPYKS